MILLSTRCRLRRGMQETRWLSKYANWSKPTFQSTSLSSVWDIKKYRNTQGPLHTDQCANLWAQTWKWRSPINTHEKMIVESRWLSLSPVIWESWTPLSSTTTSYTDLCWCQILYKTIKISKLGHLIVLAQSTSDEAANGPQALCKRVFELLFQALQPLRWPHYSPPLELCYVQYFKHGMYWVQESSKHSTYSPYQPSPWIRGWKRLWTISCMDDSDTTSDSHLAGEFFFLK